MWANNWYIGKYTYHAIVIKFIEYLEYKWAFNFIYKSIVDEPKLKHAISQSV